MAAQDSMAPEDSTVLGVTGVDDHHFSMGRSLRTALFVCIKPQSSLSTVTGASGLGSSADSRKECALRELQKSVRARALSTSLAA